MLTESQRRVTQSNIRMNVITWLHMESGGWSQGKEDEEVKTTKPGAKGKGKGDKKSDPDDNSNSRGGIPTIPRKLLAFADTSLKYIRACLGVHHINTFSKN